MGGLGSGRHKGGGKGKMKTQKVNYRSKAFKIAARRQMRAGTIPRRKL